MATTPQPKPKTTEAKVYQVYKSTIANQRLITPTGRLIKIIGGQYITDNKEDIEFLDKEISSGFPYIKKEKEITSEDLDPMAVLRRQIREEVLAEQSSTRDLGNDPEHKTKGVNTLNTDKLKAMAADSGK